MDKKEKAMDFGIRLLDSLNYLLTLTLIAILFVSGLFYYIHWKYGREQEPNQPETVTPVIAIPEPVSPELMKVLDYQSIELVDGRYLITLDDPGSEFRNWWQMVPNLAGSNDSFKSWPSGNMTIAAMMFSLPMLADVTKKRSEGRNFRCFIVACAFVLLYGYNRIHMTNHFLTDVCFGTLITYLIHAVVSKALLPTDKLD